MNASSSQFIILMICLSALISCNREKTKNNKHAEITILHNYELIKPSNGSFYNFGDKIEFSIRSKNTSQNPEKIIVSFPSKKSDTLSNTNFILDTASYGFGKQNVSVQIINGTNTETIQTSIVVFSNIVPKAYTYKIEKTLLHDITSYTQGLEIHEDILYESTGLYGQSKLRKFEYPSLQLLAEIKLEPGFFGEGLTKVGNKLYQLTWKEKTVFIYDANDFSRIGQFNLPVHEGWGLSYNGKEFLLSDGSSCIYFLDTLSFKIINSIDVVDNQARIKELNELEYINGDIYANVYGKEYIVIIDPLTGRVRGKIDCEGLLKISGVHPSVDVMNGIAYLPKSKRLLVTGKNWAKMFEISIVKK